MADIDTLNDYAVVYGYNLVLIDVHRYCEALSILYAIYLYVKKLNFFKMVSIML